MSSHQGRVGCHMGRNGMLNGAICHKKCKKWKVKAFLLGTTVAMYYEYMRASVFAGQLPLSRRGTAMLSAEAGSYVTI